MKLIKEGNWNLPWSAQMVCKTCEATLQIDEKDVKANEYAVGFHYVCMVCGKQNPIPATGICQRLRESVDKKRKRRGYDYSSGKD